MRKLIERCVIDDCPITIEEHYTKRGVFRVQLERQGHWIRMVPQGSNGRPKVLVRNRPTGEKRQPWMNNHWQVLYAAA